jgi:hypothetical protein
MIFIPAESELSIRSPLLRWESPPALVVPGSDAWSRASTRIVGNIEDETGHALPLKDEVWLTTYPPRGDGLWHTEAELIGPAVVGRGADVDESAKDWQIRFRRLFQRYLEMRPFEMTSPDKDLWHRLQAIVDVPQYKATKPMLIRQHGKVQKSRPGLTVVEWEDGSREEVEPRVFDEPFARFLPGQPFEALVSRDPLSFQIIRADAVRKLPSRYLFAKENSDALWTRVASANLDSEVVDATEIDEKFWLSKK